MCDCENCQARDFCKLDPDLSLEDAMACYQLRNAEVYYAPFYRQFNPSYTHSFAI